MRFKKISLLIVILSTFVSVAFSYNYDIDLPYSYSCDEPSSLKIDNYAKLQAARLLAFDVSENFCKIKKIYPLQEFYSKTFDYKLYESLDNDRMRLSNDRTLIKRNFYLGEMVNSQDQILSMPFSLQKIRLQSNLDRIQQYLEYNKVYSNLRNISKGKYELTISSDSNVSVNIKRLNLDGIFPKYLEIHDGIKLHRVHKNSLDDFFKNYQFKNPVNASLEIAKNLSSFSLEGQGLEIKGFNPIFTNSFSQKEVKVKDNYFIFLPKLENVSFKDISNDIGSFMSKNKKINFMAIDDKTIKLKSGEYQINDNLILPYGFDLIIEQGVTISIGDRSSIIVYGGLEIRGTDSEPVVIKKLNSNFGSFAIIGDSLTKIKINHLKISGGTESKINGLYISGALSLYNHRDISIQNSKIVNNDGEDGLNIKDSIFYLSNNTFKSNYSDQVDLDNSFGIVVNNLFTRENLITDSSMQLNGDGLDLSNSVVLIQDNIFSNFSDKGISIGEASTSILENNSIIGNNIGVAVKDGSTVYSSDARLEDNISNFSVYNKKAFFDKPVLFRELVSESDKFSQNENSLKAQLGELEELKNTILSTVVLDKTMPIDL
jgi:hypothetical protein